MAEMAPTKEQKAAAEKALAEKAEARRAELLDRVGDGGGGSVVITLHAPLEAGGVSHTKLTMTPVTVGVIRRTPLSADGTYNALDMAASLVTEPGAVDAIANEDDMDLVVYAALAQQGKFKAASKVSTGA